MSQLALAIGSLLVLSVAAFFVAQLLRLAVCPVCAGVAGSWLWMIVARETGILVVDPVVLAILLGASAVGLAQSISSRLPQGRSPQFWKALMLAGGFTLAYALSNAQWAIAAAALVQLAITAALALRPESTPARNEQAIALLEERMKKCC